MSDKIAPVVRGGFVKGVSGNPSGVTKIARMTRVLAERSTPEALATLLAIMRSPKASLKLRKECAVELLDRGGVYVTKSPIKEEETEEEAQKVEWDDNVIDGLLGDGDEEPEKD